MSRDLHRHQRAAQRLPGEPVGCPHEKAAQPSTLIGSRTGDSGLPNLLSPISTQVFSERFISSCSFCRSSARCSVHNSRRNSSSARDTMW